MAMFCEKCQRDFPVSCICEDRDERLTALMGNANWGFLVCPECSKHADLCECDEPEPERKIYTTTDKKEEGEMSDHTKRLTSKIVQLQNEIEELKHDNMRVMIFGAIVGAIVGAILASLWGVFLMEFTR